MRISFFVPKCSPENSHGRYVIELAKRLGSSNHVTVYAGSFASPLGSLVRCRVLPILNRPAVLRLATLWSAAAVLPRKSRFDIVHVQGADAPVCDVVTAHCCDGRHASGWVSPETTSSWCSLGAIIGSRGSAPCSRPSAALAPASARSLWARPLAPSSASVGAVMSALWVRHRISRPSTPQRTASRYPRATTRLAWRLSRRWRPDCL